MLQQTQVKTAIPYFEKFLAAFPTVASLARAPRPRVLRHWSGLGYYRRAENLHSAARQIVRRHGGELPQEPDQLKALAGIGDYTAGALLSIAFNKPYAAVDGNVRRVLSRLCGLNDKRRLRHRAEALVPATRPGDFNQAMMELGATVCIPRTPRCPAMPAPVHMRRCVAPVGSEDCQRQESKTLHQRRMAPRDRAPRQQNPPAASIGRWLARGPLGDPRRRIDQTPTHCRSAGRSLAALDS